MASIKDQTLKGVKWSAVEKFSLQAIQFIFGLIMARLLTPSDYGIIGMVTVFLALSRTFSDSGFSRALIRKTDRTSDDCSTVFIFNAVVSIFVYGILYVSAPYIALFFQIPLLTAVTRVVGLKIIIDALCIVQKALFTANIEFKVLARISVISVLISGSIGIFLAYTGWGVWALVAQILLNSFFTTLFSWIYSSWRPLRRFSSQSFKELFSFGSKLMLSSIIATLYNEFISLLIGKKFDSASLGLFSRARHFANLPSGIFLDVIQRVTYPILANIKDDDARLTDIYRKYIRGSSLIVFFFMLLLLALARPIVLFLLSEKWEECIPFLQILCLSTLPTHISAINLNLLQVKGRSDLFLNLEIIKRVISVAMMVIAVQWGVAAVCWALVIYGQIAIVINTYYTGKLLGIGYWTQMKDFFPYFVMTSISVLPVFIICENNIFPNIIEIIFGAILSIILYMTMLYFKKDEIFINFVVKRVKKYIK